MTEIQPFDGTPDRQRIDALIGRLRARTPARLLLGRAGPSYRTETQLELRQDHAAAIDAVHAELDCERDLGPELIDRLGLFEVQSRAQSKAEYLLRPDLGRSFSDAARLAIVERCSRSPDLQVVVGDGLSASAVRGQVPSLLPAIAEAAEAQGWSLGRPFVVRYARVGLLNEVGELIDPTVAVLLIGERPGLATAESMSAYMGYRPRPGDTDARRNLISNIHARGVGIEEAARRIISLANQMRNLKSSGVDIKEA